MVSGRAAFPTTCWRGPGEVARGTGFRGFGFCSNLEYYERIFGPAPLAELERMAAVIDAQTGEPVESPACRVARELASLVGA